MSADGTGSSRAQENRNLYEDELRAFDNGGARLSRQNSDSDNDDPVARIREVLQKKDRQPINLANEKAKKAARKEVRFSLEDFNKTVNQNQQARTSLNASSQRRGSLPPPFSNDADTETLRDDDNDALYVHGVIRPPTPAGETLAFPPRHENATYTDFRDKVGTQLSDWFYDFDNQALIDDLYEKLNAYSDINVRNQKPGFPFIPVVQGDETTQIRDEETRHRLKPLNYHGLINKETFAKLTKENPDALFQEIKLRVLMMMAYRDQSLQLHTMCQTLDRNLKIVASWADNLGQQIGRATATATDDVLVKRLHAEMADKDEDIADLHQIIVDLNREKMILQKGLAARPAHTEPQPRQIRDDLRDVTPAPSEARTQRTDHTNQTTATTTSGKNSKSSRAPDVPVFHDEKDKDTIKFDRWHRKMQNKLMVNADHYPDEFAKINYIETRLGGKADDDIAPYLEIDNPFYIDTAEALLEHMMTQYGDPNKDADALDKWEDLQMKAGDDYNEFRHKFVRYVSLTSQPKSSWKTAFNRKVLGRISDLLVASFVDPTCDFEKFATLGAQINRNYQVSQTRRNKNTDAGGSGSSAKKGGARRVGVTTGATTGPARGGRGGFTSARGGMSSSTRRPRLSEEELTKLAEEGRCFVCKEIGHRANRCPATRNDRASRIANIVSSYNRNQEAADTPAAPTAPTVSADATRNPSNKEKLDLQRRANDEYDTSGSEN